MSELPPRTSPEPATPRADDDVWGQDWENQEPPHDDDPMDRDNGPEAAPAPAPDTSRSLLEGGIGSRLAAFDALQAEAEAADLEAATAEQERREAEKQEAEKQKFEDSLYGEPMQAPSPDASAEEKAKYFAPERRQRIADADEYEQHLAMMASPEYRSSTLDGNVKSGVGSAESQLEAGTVKNVSIDVPEDYGTSKEYSGEDADLLKRMDKYANAANELRGAAYEAEQRGDTDKAQELMREYDKANKNFALLQRKQERDKTKRQEEAAQAGHDALIARSAALPPVGDAPEEPSWMNEPDFPDDEASRTSVVDGAGAPPIDWGGSEPSREDEEEDRADDNDDTGHPGGYTGAGLPRRAPSASGAPGAAPSTGLGGLPPDSPPAGPFPGDVRRPGRDSGDSRVGTATGDQDNLDPFSRPAWVDTPAGRAASSRPDSGSHSSPYGPSGYGYSPDHSSRAVWGAVPSAGDSAPRSSSDPDRDTRRYDPDLDTDADRDSGSGRRSFREVGLLGFLRGERGRGPRPEGTSPSSERLGFRGRVVVGLGVLAMAGAATFGGISAYDNTPERAAPAASAPANDHERDGNDGSNDTGGGDNVNERPVANAERGYTVAQGEGFFSLLSKEGIPAERQAGAMQKILDLADRNPEVGRWVYQRKVGEPGIAKTGVMPANVLNLIKNVAR